MAKSKHRVIQSHRHRWNSDSIGRWHGKASEPAAKLIGKQSGRTALKWRQARTRRRMPFAQMAVEQVQAVYLVRGYCEYVERIGGEKRVAAQPRLAKRAIQQQAVRV